MNVHVLCNLLTETNYDEAETNFLVEGFTHGFDIEYRGPWHRWDQARNIPLQVGVGDKYEMWKKFMDEVKAKRYAGPYDEIPFEYYIQSPCGLVPKAGNKTRLIFHLSYDFGPEEHQKSVNHFIPHELCTVKYNDLDHAMLNTLKLVEQSMESKWGSLQKMLKSRVEKLCKIEKIFYSKTDLVSAFRILPLKKKCYPILIMKANHPWTGKTKFFVEKNLAFGSSISCSHFQRFSNALKHIYENLVGQKMTCTKYLDDFYSLVHHRVCATRG